MPQSQLSMSDASSLYSPPAPPYALSSTPPYAELLSSMYSARPSFSVENTDADIELAPFLHTQLNDLQLQRTHRERITELWRQRQMWSDSRKPERCHCDLVHFPVWWVGHCAIFYTATFPTADDVSCVSWVPWYKDQCEEAINCVCQARFMFYSDYMFHCHGLHELQQVL
jgi:hypothetical protein